MHHATGHTIYYLLLNAKHIAHLPHFAQLLTQHILPNHSLTGRNRKENAVAAPLLFLSYVFLYVRLYVCCLGQHDEVATGSRVQRSTFALQLCVFWWWLMTSHFSTEMGYRAILRYALLRWYCATHVVCVAYLYMQLMAACLRVCLFSIISSYSPRISPSVCIVGMSILGWYAAQWSLSKTAGYVRRYYISLLVDTNMIYIQGTYYIFCAQRFCWYK